ncbi:MAG: aminopeptidase P N-terminal domain-containing protein [Rhodothermales bacterium]
MLLFRRLFLLLLFLTPASLLAQDGVPRFTEDFPPEEFARRRARVFDAMGPEAVAVIQGAPSPRGYVRFRQSNEFYYLTGIEVPHAYLLLDGSSRSAYLYLPHRNERRERSEGHMLSAEDADYLRDTLGFDDVYGPDLLAEHLGRRTRRGAIRTLFTPFSPAEGLSVSRDLGLRTNTDIASDPWDGRPSREGHFIYLLRTRFPQFEIGDLTPTLDALRLIKSPNELALIRKATRLSGLALMEAMRSTEPGIRESDLDAVAKYIFYREGAQGDAYYSLVASGRNAYFPHYNAGKRTMQDGDFLLMDYAPDVGYYMSDVTRMWPVNGTFSEGQRALYGFYLACYRAILGNIRPGATAAQIAREAAADMDRILAAASFSKPEYQRAAAQFVTSYHARSASENTYLGHWVGMATHDVGTYTGPLKPGMVFTIEPALRVPEERIYIRLEDLIIITEEGAEIVSDFVPMGIDEIERLMQEPGLLQQYPREVSDISGVVNE